MEAGLKNGLDWRMGWIGGWAGLEDGLDWRFDIEGWRHLFVLCMIHFRLADF